MIETTSEKAFNWIAKDVRPTKENIKEFLRKHPNDSINIGDGKGWYKKREISISTTVTKIKNKMLARIVKSEKYINCKGFTWEEKKEFVIEHIIKKYNKLHNSISFEKITNEINSDNPDGLKLIIKIEGRHILQDYRGSIKIGKLFKKLNILEA